ncbi:MAG: hypothetical protein R2845_08535 [Thermomicrobiales bacterium]
MEKKRKPSFDVVVAALVGLIAGAGLTIGLIVLAIQFDIGISALKIIGVLLVCLGFVGLCAVVWNAVRKLMD